MSKKQKAAKMPYFREIHTQMTDNEHTSFWDLTPMQDNLLGRTVSHVIFRSIGVDVAMYLASKMENDTEIPSLVEDTNPPDIADYEFLSAWNNLNQSYSTLQLEALSFRALINSRDYQVWLADTLSKIPLVQWEKSRTKFTKQCGNPLYIAGYHMWMNTLRGKEGNSLYSNWLPKEVAPIEEYALSRLLRGYDLDEEMQEKIAVISKEAKEHGYLSMQMTQGRVSKLYNSTQLLGYTEFGLTDTGLEYYENSAVYWRLWAESIDHIAPEGADPVKVAACLANSLMTSVSSESLGRLRTSFLNEWSKRHKTKLEEYEESRLEKELSEAEKEIATLKADLRAKESELVGTKRELTKSQEQCEKLTAGRTEYAEQNNELKLKLKATEKKLSKALEEVETLTKAQEDTANLEIPTTDTALIALSKKVNTLESGLCEANKKIDDLHILLSADDEETLTEYITESCNLTEEEDDYFTRAMQEFTGRLVLSGGTRPWQEKVRKCFEDQGVKVRTCGLGEDLTGLRPTDTVLLNVIQNKHKYSVRLVNEVRSLGARLVVCNINNIEQTLRLVLNPDDREYC